MLKIAHKGNTEGSDFENKNNPIYIDKGKIDKGFDSEIDIIGYKEKKIISWT